MDELQGDVDSERAVSEDHEAYLGRRPVLLHWRRQGAGVGGGVGGGRLHIVVAEAAEEGAEDAPAPLLLQAAVGLGRWRETGGWVGRGEDANCHFKKHQHGSSSSQFHRGRFHVARRVGCGSAGRQPQVRSSQ